MKAAGWILALLLAAPLAAEEQHGTLEDVEARASCAWPDDLRGGYFPIRVELANRGAEEAEVRVTAKHVYVLDQSEKRLRLAPGETRAFDLYGRADGAYDGRYAVELEVGGELLQLGHLGYDSTDSSWQGAVMLVGAESAALDELERWAKLLRPHELAVASIGFAELPERQLGWSSLRAVLLDTSRGMPPAAGLAPLLAWTRLGGTLVLHGPRALEEARAAPALAGWLEPRFELVAGRGTSARTFACALGRLLVLAGDEPAASEEAAGLIAANLADARGWLPSTPGASAGASQLAPLDTPAPGLPLRTLAAILVLFALLIGPVNAIVVKRSGRPVLLLLTVPGSALVCGALLLGYGVLAQGLDVKVVRNTYTLLDQRLHRASTADALVLFAGMSPGAGLRPGPGSAVYVARKMPQRRRFRYEQSFRMDLSDGLLLAEDYLPVRQTSHAWVLGDDTARGRVDVAAQGGGLELTNGLGAAIDALVLRAADGEWHRLAAPLAEGERAALEPCSYLAGSNESAPAVSAIFTAGPTDLPPGCYAATLARSPFVDECGIEQNELAGRHYLVGLLEEEASR